MQPNHFRAYAIKTVLLGGSDHKVEEVVAEGDTDNGIATLKSDEVISQVAFYDHEKDGQVCLGRLVGPFGPGEVTADFANIPEIEPAADRVIIGGVEYQKA